MDPVRYAVFFAEPCTHVYAHVCTTCGFPCQPAQWHLSSCGYSCQPYPRGSINRLGLFSSILQFLNIFFLCSLLSYQLICLLLCVFVMQSDCICLMLSVDLSDSVCL